MSDTTTDDYSTDSGFGFSEDDAISALEALGLTDAATTTSESDPAPEPTEDPSGTPQTLPESDPEPDPEEDPDEDEDQEDDDLIPPGGPLWPTDPDNAPQPDGAPLADPATPPGTGQPLADPSALISLPDGRVVTAAQIMAALPNQPATPPTPTPAETPRLDLSWLKPEDIEELGPAGRALFALANHQQGLLQNLTTQQSALAAAQEKERREVTTSAVNTAASEFQGRYRIPQAEMDEVIKFASRSRAIDTYMSGTDPRTGNPTTPDAHAAVMAALEIGYWQSPKCRQFEFNRMSERQSSINAKRKKLGGVGGSSASAKRTTNRAPATEQEAVEMMTKEVAALMAGEN